MDRIQDGSGNNYEKAYENKKLIEFALDNLSKNEKNVIFKYYMEDYTKKDIAKEMNISQTQVARIIKKALNKMYTVIEQENKKGDK